MGKMEWEHSNAWLYHGSDKEYSVWQEGTEQKIDMKIEKK